MTKQNIQEQQEYNHRKKSINQAATRYNTIYNEVRAKIMPV
jgi:hypothetical protein